MLEILHQIRINGAAEAVYNAITTQKGLASWWTSDVQATPEESTVAIFGFNNRAVIFRMRVEKLVPHQLVVWSCDGGVEEWTGTKLRFEILPAGSGKLVLKFTHAGWRSTDGAFALCNTDWGRLMYYLKDAIEGRGAGPMMS